MKFKFFLSAVILAITVLYFFSAPAVVAQSNTASDCLQLIGESQKMTCLQNIVDQLATQIQAFLGQSGWCHTFNTNLGYANSGSVEVGYLHTALNKQGFSYAPDTGNTYAEGTAFAIAKFQEKYASEILVPYGLTNGTGFTGVSTRAKLNQLYACQTTTFQPTTQPGTQQTPQSQTQALIAITSPNNAVTWAKGGTYSVTWSSSGVAGYVSMVLKDETRQNLGAIWSVNNVFNSGYYSFILPSFSSITSGNKYRVCVSQASVSDCNDSYITITDSIITDIADDQSSANNQTNQTNQTSLTCSETDNALDYYTKGAATGKNNWDGLTSSYADFCSGNTLTEYKCSNNLVAKTTYNCSNGCSNGACQTISPICSEDDTGPYDYGVKGTATGKNNWDGSISSYTDSCLSTTLTEYQCSAGLVAKLIYNCSGGCVNGACYLSGALAVASPDGGEQWQRGTAQKIEWVNYEPDIFDPYLFEINLINSAGLTYSITKNADGSLFYNWTVADANGVKDSVPNGSYKIQVCRTGTSVCSTSGHYFSIVDAAPVEPPITVTSPNGGEQFSPGGTITSAWIYSGEDGAVDIRLIGVFGTNDVGRLNLDPVLASAGYYNWQIPFNIAGGYYKVKIDFSGSTDESDSYFYISGGW